MGLLPHVTDKDLLFKGTRKRQYRKVHTVKRAPKGEMCIRDRYKASLEQAGQAVKETTVFREVKIISTDYKRSVHTKME